MKITERLHVIYEQYKDNFKNTLPASFHNALWQVMVNEIHKGKLKCFYATNIDTEYCLALVVANEGGFIPLCYFNEDLSMEQCESLAYQIGSDVFDVDEKTADQIVGSSMFKNEEL